MPDRPNQRWSLDIVCDVLSDGSQFRAVRVVDDFSHSGIRVARELDRVIGYRGKPKMIVSDNGTELTSHAISKWAKGTNVD